MNESQLKTESSKVYLRAFCIEDEEFLINLRSNKSLFELTTGNNYFSSPEHSKKLLRENLFSNGEKIYLMACQCDTNEPIGYTSILDIDHINKKAQWSGIVISPNFTGKGLATLVGKEVLRFAFEEMNLNRIYAFVLESNLASLRMTVKLGFSQEGLLRNDVFKANHYQSVLIVSILKTEYESLNLKGSI